MTRHRSRVDWNDDAGQMGGIEVLPFGVLIFVIGSLLIANAWAVVDAKFATASAAREAARAYVEAADQPSAASDGDAAARRALDGHGRSGERAEIDFELEDDGGYTRCTRVTAEVSYEVPAISLPFIGGYGHAFAVTSDHSEVIDPFRDGLPAGGGC